MSREHAPAVKELAENLLTLILPEPFRTSPPVQIADTLDEMAAKIEEMLAPLLKDISYTANTALHGDGEDCDSHCTGDKCQFKRLRAHLALWEPPNMEAK